MRIEEMLPQSIRHLFSRQILNLEIQGPTLNCQDCTGARLNPSRYGRRKCCDYWPHIWNWQVKRTGALQKSSGVVTPLGVLAPQNARKKSNREPCPYYRIAEGSCEIWTARPAECATFFCVEIPHEMERDFWSHLKGTLSFIEQGLAQMWMIEAGYEWNLVRDLTDWAHLESGDDTLPPRNLWPSWQSEPKVYFARAEQWFESLDHLIVLEWWREQGVDFEQDLLGFFN